MTAEPTHDPQAFLAALDAGTWNGPFRHADHVYAAWLMLRQDSLDRVLARYTGAIRRLAASRGADGLYHQTITWAYLFAIQERMATMDRGHDWPAFRDAHPDLFHDHRRFLGRYYSQRLLDSDLARRSFVLPDRCPGLAA